MFFDPLYLLFALPGVLLSMWASFRVRAAFSQYSEVPSSRGYTGAQAARRLLDDAGLHEVDIVEVPGELSDHYDPTSRQLALSSSVYRSHSIASVGVACHEAGHALQHAAHYAPMGLRSALVPMAGIGTNLGLIIMMVGLMLSPWVVMFGAALFSMVLLFQVVTLPVEFDASNRAKRLIVDAGIIEPYEREGVDRVLNAAAWTYVAAAFSTLMVMLYYLFRAGLLGGRSHDD